MSIQALAWVLEHSEATLADRLVLLAIANHADARGWNAWPAVDSIAREARVHRVTVFRSIEALESAGELTVRRRPGRSNMYGLAAFGGLQDATGGGLQDATGKGVADCNPGVASSASRGGKSLPKPSVTVNEPSRARALTPTPALPAETRARGAEFFRALRKGE